MKNFNFNENWDGRLPRKNNNTNGINDLSEASQQVIGKYRFTPFTEGSIKGWTISIQNHGKVGHIEEPSNKSSTSPFKIYRSNDPVFPAGKKAFVQGVLRMTAYPGTETRIVSEKEIRFAPRQMLKAVSMWLDKNGGMKEGVENTEVVAEMPTPVQNTLSEASQRVIGKYRFSPFTKDTNKEGVKGWTISIQNKGVVGYIAEPPSLSSITVKIYRTKGLSFKDFFPGELKMSAYPGPTNEEPRIKSDTLHYVPRQLLKGVAMWMDKYGTKALTEDVETTEVVAEILTPVQADAVRRGAANAKYLDKAIADFAKDMKALAAKGDPRKDLKAFKAYIPIIHKIEDGMDAMGGGLTWPYDEGTGKTKAVFLKGLSPEQKKADKALRSISVWWTQSGLQRITPRSEKIWNDGWNSYRKYMGERVTEETTAADGAQSLDEVQFITPKVPLTGGSNNFFSKEKTDYKLYVELKDVVKDAIGILSEAELKIRNPSKNSTVNILQTVVQAKQRLKIAVK